MRFKWGDGTLIFATFVWVSIAVGPWQVGIAIFLVAFILNALECWLGKRRNKEADDAMELIDSLIDPRYKS